MRTKLYIGDIAAAVLGAGSLLLWRQLDPATPGWLVLIFVLSVGWFLTRWYVAVVPRSFRILLSSGETVSRRASHFFLLVVAITVLACILVIAWIFVPTN